MALSNLPVVERRGNRQAAEFATGRRLLFSTSRLGAETVARMSAASMWNAFGFLATARRRWRRLLNLFFRDSFWRALL
jgi:hypothetical protein